MEEEKKEEESEVSPITITLRLGGEVITEGQEMPVTPLSIDHMSGFSQTMSDIPRLSITQSDDGYTSSTGSVSEPGTPRTTELYVTLETLLLVYCRFDEEERSLSRSMSTSQEEEKTAVSSAGFAMHRHLSALLLFLDRVTDKHVLLAKIEELIRDAETTDIQRRGLFQAIDFWSRSYPEDFIDDAKMAKKLAIIRSIPRSSHHLLTASADDSRMDSYSRRPTLSRSRSMTARYRSPSVSPRATTPKQTSSKKKRSRGSLGKITSFFASSKSSIDVTDFETVGLRFGLYFYNPSKYEGGWMSIQKRQEEDHLENHYISAAVIRSIPGGKTIEWRREFPIWFMIKLAKKKADELGHITRAPRPDEIWDQTWPWLTLYFECTFPEDFVSTSLKPKHVAEAWTLLKYEVFIRVKRRELNGLHWKNPDTYSQCPFVRRMIDMFNAESKWAVMIFLSEADLPKRALKLEKLLKIMNELIKLGNLDSACAIRAGILKISRKKIPIDKISESTRKLLDDALKFDDMKHKKPNQLTRMRLRQGLSVIPVFGVTTNRLYMKEQKMKALKEDGLINLRWLETMIDVCNDQVLPAQRLYVDESGYGVQSSSLFDPNPLPFRTNLMYYSGITIDRRDVRLLLIRELKKWGCETDQTIEDLLDYNSSAVIERRGLSRYLSSAS